MQNREKSDYDNVISSYFENEQVTALINLKVETKEADVIAENISKDPAVSDCLLSDWRYRYSSRRQISELFTIEKIPC